jgi:hypothetical protein
VFDTTMRKQTHIAYIRHNPTGGKDQIMFVVCFFNICFAIHSVAGKKIHGNWTWTCFLMCTKRDNSNSLEFVLQN